MKDYVFKVGDVIFECGDRNGDKYTVVSPPSEDGALSVVDEDGNLVLGKDGLPLFSVNDVILFDPEAEKQAAKLVSDELVTATDCLNKAFEALERARAVGYKVDMGLREFMSEQTVDFSGLADALNKNGWSMSSLWC